MRAFLSGLSRNSVFRHEGRQKCSMPGNNRDRGGDDMPKAIFRFYAELNDALPKQKRGRDFHQCFDRGTPLRKELLALGVSPHTVDLVLVRGNPVTFDYVLQEGDRLSVYPVFERFNIQGVTALRRSPLRTIRFIADTDLPELAVLMRVRGFDVHYNAAFSPGQIIERSLEEKRIILTRNRDLLKSEGVTRGLLVTEQHPEDQAERIVYELKLDS